jgi:hypothetical protein
MPRWVAVVIVCAGACASQPRRASPFAPSQRHAAAPRIATFASSTMSARRTEVSAAPDVEVGAGGGAEGFVVALRKRAPSLHRCYVAALRVDPSMGARARSLKVHVHVGASGAVDRARATGGPARLDECVDAVIKRVSLPRGAPLELEVPLVFRAG